jgi:hypothetical protein
MRGTSLILCEYYILGYYSIFGMTMYYCYMMIMLSSINLFVEFEQVLKRSSDE